ncbi:MAG: septum formation protein Maf [Deltaproteobacteria bacterium]|nr:MAG: septum formation protein Maf [Deltaproteobacteria bacterium]
MKLTLASRSSYRRALVLAVGLSVEVVPPRVDERAVQRAIGRATASEVASRLARAKAAEVAARVDGLVLGADQVLWDGREVIGKPSDPGDHVRRLQSLRGQCHDLLTGWCLYEGADLVREGLARTTLKVRSDLSDDELRAYVATGEGTDCAGGYAIEGLGGWLFEEVKGDYFNVLGLPLLDVITALRELGWRYPVASEGP